GSPEDLDGPRDSSLADVVARRATAASDPARRKDRGGPLGDRGGRPGSSSTPPRLRAAGGLGAMDARRKVLRLLRLGGLRKRERHLGPARRDYLALPRSARARAAHAGPVQLRLALSQPRRPALRGGSQAAWGAGPLRSSLTTIRSVPLGDLRARRGVLPRR